MNCDHFYAHASPEGTRYGIGICIYCNMPDPDELTRLGNALEVMRSTAARMNNAVTTLNNILRENPHTSEYERIEGKLDGVKLAESYLYEELRIREK